LGFALLVATVLAASAPTTAFAQAKEVITFAAVTFSEAGRGRLKAWVDKFNKSQNAIEVQPVALPFACSPRRFHPNGRWR
jgi:multiple sugar transport system substrate-binding protein